MEAKFTFDDQLRKHLTLKALKYSHTNHRDQRAFQAFTNILILTLQGSTKVYSRAVRVKVIITSMAAFSFSFVIQTSLY